MTLAKDLVGAGKSIDTDRFHVIFPSAPGSPGSSSPSTSGLGPDFSHYTIDDMVATRKAPLDHLGAERLRGVVGIAVGGFQTLAWVTKHPDMMDRAIPIAVNPGMRRRNLGVFGLMSDQITSDPAQMDGRHEAQPRDAMWRGFMSTHLFHVGPRFCDANVTDAEAAVKGLQNAGLRSEKMDANDIMRRNRAMSAFDVSDALTEATAPTLVIGTLEDELFPPKEELKPIAFAAPGAEVWSSPGCVDALSLGSPRKMRAAGGRRRFSRSRMTSMVKRMSRTTVASAQRSFRTSVLRLPSPSMGSATPRTFCETP